RICPLTLRAQRANVLPRFSAASALPRYGERRPRFPSTETIAVVRRGEIDLRADGNDARRVHLALAAVVMPLDVIDADGLSYSWHLIEITGVIPQIRVVGDPPEIAFEMTVVDGVNPHERGEYAPVRFSQLPPGEETLPRQPFFDLVESLENPVSRFLVSRLAGGETRTINPVIDIGIDHVVDGIDLTAQLSRIIVRALNRECAQSRVEHADDFRRFVNEDRWARLVPQRRDRNRGGVVWIGKQIDFGKRRFAVHRIGRATASSAEFPSSFSVERLGDGDRDGGLELLERAEDQGAMRPGAGRGYVEVIAAGFRGKSAFAGRTRAAVARHEIAKDRCWPDEPAFLGA